MLDMSLDWWEFIVRAIVVYAVLLLIVRLSGKRTVGQFTPFDLLVVMLLSEAVSNSLSGGDDSLLGGLIIAVTLVALNMVIAFATSRSKRIEAIMDGKPVVIGRDGELFDDLLKSNRIGMSEIENAFHAADVTKEEMAYAILEADGTINILKKKQESS